MNASTPNLRFREARERPGLSPDELAARFDVSPPNIWDIEAFEGDLTACYSPREVHRFCKVLRISPVELFSEGIVESPISAEELVQRVHTECRSHKLTLEQFEDVVGWRLGPSME